MKRRTLVAATAFAAGCVLGGCGPRGEDAATVAAPAQAARTEPQSGPPLTEEECTALSQAIEQAVKARDSAGLNSKIDWNALLETATAGAGSANEQKQFSKGVLKSMLQENRFAGEVVKMTENGGSYELLHLENRKGRRSALFRARTPEGALNYHKLLLARRPDGQVKAVDIYVFAAGELMSETLRRAYLPLVVHSSRNFLEKLTRSENDYIKNIDTILKMTNSLRDGQPQETLAAYAKLPPSLQKEKSVLIIRMRAAQAVSEAEYAAAIEAIRTNFPDDPSLDLISLDGFVLKKQFDEALACLDRLDKSVGGDPYLDYMRGNVNLEKGDAAAALKCAQRAGEGMPKLIDPRWVVVAASMQLKDFDTTLAELKSIKHDFDFKFGDLSKQEPYAEFAKSPQYQEWIKFLNESGEAQAQAPAQAKPGRAPRSAPLGPGGTTSRSRRGGRMPPRR
jgi:hypothetical protein